MPGEKGQEQFFRTLEMGHDESFRKPALILPSIPPEPWDLEVKLLLCEETPVLSCNSRCRVLRSRDRLAYPAQAQPGEGQHSNHFCCQLAGTRAAEYLCVVRGV